MSIQHGRLATGLCFSLVSLFGCASDDGDVDSDTDSSTESQSLADVDEAFPANADATGDTSKACVVPRSDITQTILLSSGYWGTWSPCISYCPANSFAYAVRVRSEPGQGSGDDTAMNGIALNCYHRTTGAYTGYVTSNPGYWGNWLATAKTFPYVVTNPFVGGSLKVEAPQGSGDDTAANTVRLRARNGSWSQPDAYTAWGTWRSPVSCAPGSAICGVRTRVESWQLFGDDTALNGVQFACCRF